MWTLITLVVLSGVVAFALASWAHRGRYPDYYKYRKENNVKWWQL